MKCSYLSSPVYSHNIWPEAFFVGEHVTRWKKTYNCVIFLCREVEGFRNCYPFFSFSFALFSSSLQVLHCSSQLCGHSHVCLQTHTLKSHDPTCMTVLVSTHDSPYTSCVLKSGDVIITYRNHTVLQTQNTLINAHHDPCSVIFVSAAWTRAHLTASSPVLLPPHCSATPQ